MELPLANQGGNNVKLHHRDLNQGPSDNQADVLTAALYTPFKFDPSDSQFLSFTRAWTKLTGNTFLLEISLYTVYSTAALFTIVIGLGCFLYRCHLRSPCHSTASDIGHSKQQ